MSKKWIAFVLSFVLVILALRLFFYFSSLKSFQNGEKIDTSFLLLTDPTVEGKFQKFTINQQGRGRLFVTLPSYPRYVYGQELHLRGVVKRQVISEKNTKNESNGASSLLRGENVINTVFFPTIEAKDVWYLTPLSSLRKNLITIYSSSLNPASEALMLGIVFGIRSTMPKELSADLVTTGVIHITAASGMNVTMVAGAVFFLLSGLLRRQIAIVVGCVFVWTYAVLAGLEPSILRAAIMSSFAFGAGLTGRQNTSLLALLFTGAVMLFIKPGLLTDVGFLLSCLSTAGIILFGNIFRAKRGGDPALPETGESPVQEKESLLGSFRQDLQTTSAAQAGTLPVLFLYFGQYNILSVLVNGLILWTIPMLMVLGSVAAFIGLFFPPLAHVVLYLTIPLLAYIEYVITFFSRYPVFVHFQSVSAIFVIGYYCFLLAVFLFFRSKRS